MCLFPFMLPMVVHPRVFAALAVAFRRHIFILENLVTNLWVFLEETSQ